MKIGFVSRWGVRCGVSTYTDQLVSAIVQQGVDVFCAAEIVGGLAIVPTKSNIDVIRCWDGKDMNIDDMYVQLKIRIGEIGIAHFQHEFGIMNHGRPMHKLITVLRNAGVSSIFTCHTVMDTSYIHTEWFFNEMVRHIDAIVVHTSDAKNAIIERGHNPDKIHVIPHGTLEGCHVAEKGFARSELGLPNDPDTVIATSVGFITPGKKQRETIREIVNLVRDGMLNPNKFLFVIAGEPGQGDPTNIKYNEEIHRFVRDCNAEDYVRVISEFVPVDKLPLWYGAADFAITASHQTFFSTSGRAHQEMAFGIPSISSRSRLLSDLDESRSLKVDPDEDDGKPFREAVLRMIHEPELRKQLSENCLKFAEETSWTNVAKKHIELYKKIARDS